MTDLENGFIEKEEAKVKRTIVGVISVILMLVGLQWLSYKLFASLAEVLFFVGFVGFILAVGVDGWRMIFSGRIPKTPGPVVSMRRFWGVLICALIFQLIHFFLPVTIITDIVMLIAFIGVIIFGWPVWKYILGLEK